MKREREREGEREREIERESRREQHTIQAEEVVLSGFRGLKPLNDRLAIVQCCLSVVLFSEDKVQQILCCHVTTIIRGGIPEGRERERGKYKSYGHTHQQNAQK